MISMEFQSLSRRRSSARNVPSGEERGETDGFRRLRAKGLAKTVRYNEVLFNRGSFSYILLPLLRQKISFAIPRTSIRHIGFRYFEVPL